MCPDGRNAHHNKAQPTNGLQMGKQRPVTYADQKVKESGFRLRSTNVAARHASMDKQRGSSEPLGGETNFASAFVLSSRIVPDKCVASAGGDPGPGFGILVRVKV